MERLGIHLTLIFAITLVPVVFVKKALAAPGLMNHQGRLTDSSGDPVVGSVSMTLTFWDAPTEGNHLGSGFEDTDEVTTNNEGFYSTDIGDEGGAPDPFVPADLFSNDTVYLQIRISVGGGTTDTLSRIRLLSTPYSFQAESADFATNADSADSALDATHADEADDADTLDSRDWTHLLVNDDTLLPAADPSVDGNRIRPELLPRGGTDGFAPGMIVDTYGDLFEKALDPRTLDSNGNGIPDKPLSEATTISGEVVADASQKWFAAIQNAQGNLVFPDEGLSDPAMTQAAMDSYADGIHPALKGKLVPNRSYTLSEAGDLSYTWSEIQPFEASDRVANGGRGFAYDPEFESIWLENSSYQDPANGIDLIYFPSEDPSKYKREKITFTGGGSRLSDGEFKVVENTASGNKLLLSAPLSTSPGGDVSNFAAPVAWRITGTGPENAGLNALVQGNTTTCDSEDVRRRGMHCFFDSTAGEWHLFMGVRDWASRVFPGHFVYALNSSDAPTSAPCVGSAPPDRNSPLVAYDEANARFFSYGGGFNPAANDTGLNNTGTENNLYIFNLGLDQWVETTLNSSGPPRESGVGFMHPTTNDFMIWGGGSNTLSGNNESPNPYTYHNDLYRFNEASSAFEEIPTINPPIVFRGTIGVYHEARNSVIVKQLDELWEMSLGPIATDGAIIKVGD